jgi:hypothetical protein
VNFRNIVREPTLHFLLIGIFLFLLYGRVAPEGDDSRTIEVSQARIDALTQQFQAVWSRPPTESELRGIIDAFVRDEVLYREGVAMGLDGDDPVIKRRVRQKMEVMSEESGTQLTPTDAELSEYLASNPDKFRRPPLLSFEQVFFSGNATVADIEAQSQQALAGLNRGEPTSAFGQPTMLPGGVNNQPLDLVARDFGETFADQLAQLPLNVWQGPIRSGFGAHLVRIGKREPAALPPLAEIRTAVIREWENERRERNRAGSYRAMAKNYRIVIDGKTASGVAP